VCLTNAADFRGADLRGADLEQARADLDTYWPDGFDPVAAGVTFPDTGPYPIFIQNHQGVILED
jgi:hypothetical protein